MTSNMTGVTRPGEGGVLLARMVAAENGDALSDRVSGPATRRRARRPARSRHAVPGRGEHRQERLPGEAAERDDHARGWHDHTQLGNEPGSSGVPLLRGRLVLWQRSGNHPGEPSLAVIGGDARRQGGDALRCRDANRKSLLRSPVKIRPVRLPRVRREPSRR